MSNIISVLKKFIKGTDKILLALSIILSSLGVLLVSLATGDVGVFSRDATVMLASVIMGVLLALALSSVDYNFILRLSPVVAVMGLILMILLLTPLGTGPAERPDVRTWIKIGSSLYFQPSEVLKVAFIITFSSHLDVVRDKINSPKTFLFLLIHAAVPIGLVGLSGDLGSALVFIFIFVAMIWAAGLNIRYFLGGAAVVAVLVPLAWRYLLGDIQKNRIRALIDPESYPDIIYQQEMGLRAIREGGFFGNGIFSPNSPGRDIPASETDMIFCVLARVFGLLGCVIVILLFILLIVRIFKTGRKSADPVAIFLSSGVAALLASQIIINIGMCLKIFPVIGITLPFLSAGGSSNLCVYLGVGVVLSIYRYGEEEREIVDFVYKTGA